MSTELRATLDKVLGKKRRKGSGLYRSVKDGDLINPIQLDEFLEGVGGILRLPAREQAPAPAPKPRIRIRIPTRWLVYLVPVAATAVLVLSVKGAEPPSAPLAALPAGITGHWTTTDKRYQNRAFDITQGEIVLKNGDRPDDQTVHAISAVRVGMRADTAMVTIDYLEAGDSYQLAVKYIAQPRPTIIFINQEEMVWYKDRPS